jgi:hypothetical protein
MNQTITKLLKQTQILCTTPKQALCSSTAKRIFETLVTDGILEQQQVNQFYHIVDKRIKGEYLNAEETEFLRIFFENYENTITNLIGQMKFTTHLIDHRSIFLQNN